jgi:NAD(P)-dependent dehydrogenase (short-subunit alcohol dehydrogenase family)
MGLCDGRVAVVTGAGRGIGRAHALALAAEGARVVVNDVGTDVHGVGASIGPAAQVVDEIRLSGGDAIANGDDISDWNGARHAIEAAISSFGRMDILVNNAGILRDRMLVNMTADEWDDVIRVHLRGTFATTRHAAEYWRDLSKANQPVDARIINTTSNSGLFGNVWQANYGAAKAAIASLTIIASMELSRYGITVNAVSPGADTRMTAELNNEAASAIGDDGYDARSPANIAAVVAWLASTESREITGRVFLVRGAAITVAEGWDRGPQLTGKRQWSPSELGAYLPDLVASARANAPTRA